jgi:hypothetical protein
VLSRNLAVGAVLRSRCTLKVGGDDLPLLLVTRLDLATCRHRAPPPRRRRPALAAWRKSFVERAGCAGSREIARRGLPADPVVVRGARRKYDTESPGCTPSLLEVERVAGGLPAAAFRPCEQLQVFSAAAVNTSRRARGRGLPKSSSAVGLDEHFLDGETPCIGPGLLNRHDGC